MHLRKLTIYIFSPVLFVTFSGCSLFFGNIKVIDEKSTRYTASDLTQLSQNWKKVPSIDPDTPETSRPDVIYESKNSSSVISLNSACRVSGAPPDSARLQDLTHELYRGMNHFVIEEEKTMKVAGAPARMSMGRGKVNQKEVELQTVVVQKDTCIFDFILVGRFPLPTQDRVDFSSFVTSFQVK